MRLQRAVALDDYEEAGVAGFGDRESRRERRSARRDRRDQRREERRERKVGRRQPQRLVPATRAPASVATLQPAPTAMAPPKPKARQLVERAIEWVDDLVDDDEPESDDEEDAAEGIGALAAWGPVVSMGRRLRIQAAAGHRAAVIELKPGLYLVADLPEAVTRTRFGLAPMLAPMMLRAARTSMDEPGRGPFARLFRRRREEPVRYVQVQAPPSARTLPGPVDDGGGVLVAAPNVGWADDATVAAVYGCDLCDRSRR